MTAADHYEDVAAQAREITRLKYLLAGAVPLSEHDAIVTPLRQFAQMVARPTTGYQCWHIAAAKEALAAVSTTVTVTPERPEWDTPLPLEEAT